MYEVVTRLALVERGSISPRLPSVVRLILIPCTHLLQSHPHGCPSLLRVNFLLIRVSQSTPSRMRRHIRQAAFSGPSDGLEYCIYVPPPGHLLTVNLPYFKRVMDAWYHSKTIPVPQLCALRHAMLFFPRHLFQDCWKNLTPGG